MTIPYNLKIKVLHDYLKGIKREQIAKNNGISTGAVSMIIDEFRKDIPDIDKLREMAVQIKATGYDINDYFFAIRYINQVKRLGLTEEKAEKIIEEFHEYAFKNSMDLPTLVDSILRGFEMAKERGIDMEYLEKYISERVLVIDAMKSNIGKLRNDIEVLPHKFNIKLADLQEYLITKPLVDGRINSMNEDLKIKDIRIKNLKDERDELKFKVQEQVSTIDKLNNLLVEKDNTIDKLNNLLVEKDNTIDKLNNQLVDQSVKEDKVNGSGYNKRDPPIDFFNRASKKNISDLYRKYNEKPYDNL